MKVMLGIRLPFKYGKKLARFIKNNGKLFLVPYKTFHHYFLIKLKKFYWQFSIKGIKMDDLMQSVFCPNSPIAQKSFNEALHCFQRFANLHYTVQWCIFKSLTLAFSFCPVAGLLEGVFSEKWILDFLLNEVLYIKAEMFSYFLTPWSMLYGSKHSR